MSSAEELYNWRNGTVDGGPNSDGRYPLTDSRGQVFLLLCPAANEATNEDLATEPETFAAVAGEARDEAVVAQTAAEGSATAASGSAAASAASATEASGYKDQAAASETAAGASASAAGTSATNADASATEAAGSASTAAADAAAADGSATDAAASAAEAHSWALTAQTTLTGLLRYMPGGWDASSGAFPTDPAVGDFWKITVAGTLDGKPVGVGDQIIWSGEGWDKIDNTESVTSVAGRVGAVSLSVADIGGAADAFAAKQDRLDGVPTDSTSAVRQLNITSNGFAGILLNGDYGDASGEPGGAYVCLRTDGPGGTSDAVLSKVNDAGSDGTGSSCSGTSSNSTLLHARNDNDLHLATNSAVRATINSTGATFTVPVSAPSLSGNIDASDIKSGKLAQARVPHITGSESAGWARLSGDGDNNDVGGSLRILTGGASARYYYDGVTVAILSDSEGNATFYGNLTVGGGFIDAYVMGKAGNYIYLRPNGPTTSTGQTIINNSGNMTVGGAVSAVSVTAATVTDTSDARFKTNVSPMVSGTLLDELRPVWFHNKKTGRDDFGFIAQEVREVYPELVHENEDGYLSLAYQRLVAPLVAEVQSLRKRVAELEECQ